MRPRLIPLLLVPAVIASISGPAIALPPGQSDCASSRPTLSDDGTQVAFYSCGSTLVAGDTNGYHDVFVRDLRAGRTARVSVGTDGTEGNLGAGNSSISGDGRAVAFDSAASNLVPGDTNSTSDIFVRDRDVDGDHVFDEPDAVTTVRVSVADAGMEGDGTSSYASISADGRHVAFQSCASTLVAGDTNGVSDVFVHDRDPDEDGIYDEPGQVSTVRVSLTAAGKQAAKGSLSFDGFTCASFQSWNYISGDGRRVAFPSVSSDVVPGDTNQTVDVFVHDRDADEDGIFDEVGQPGAVTTIRASVQKDLGQANGGSVEPSISRSGLQVAFSSGASNLGDGDTQMCQLPPNYTFNCMDIFTKDLVTGELAWASRSSAGEPGSKSSFYANVSGDGRFTAFASDATNFDPADDGGLDVFIHDNVTGTTSIVSDTAANLPIGTRGAYPAIDLHGSTLAFESSSPLLAPPDANATQDIFVRASGVMAIASVSDCPVPGCVSPPG